MSNQWAKRKAQLHKHVNRYNSKFEKTIRTSLHNHANVEEYYYEPCKLPYVIVHSYTPDFIIHPTGKAPFYLECKGYWTSSDRTKLLAVRKQNKDLDLRILFMNGNAKLNKKSKTTYGVWCDKHDFQWAEKKIPEEWL